MNITPEIANPLIYSFGNMFEYAGKQYKFIHAGMYLRDGHYTEIYKGDEKLIGITPTCLAEMAREKGETLTIFFKQWTRILIKAPRFISEEYKIEKDESLEAFFLRVAKERKYI